MNKVKLLIAVLAVAVAAPAAALAGGSAQAASGGGVEAPPVVLGVQQMPGGKIVLDQIVSNTMTANVLSWPVNDLRRAHELVALGVRGLITDRPALVAPAGAA